MHPVEWIQRFIFSSSRPTLITTVVALTVLKSGIWMMPNLGASRQLAQNPFANPFADPEAHYLVWNWLGPWIAWVVGATGPVSFFLLHLAFAAAFSATVISLCFARLSERNARVAIIVFALLPVSATAFFFVGMDGVTLFLMALAFVFPRQAIWALLVGTLLGMEHFEQAFVASFLLLVVVAVRRWLGEPALVSIGWCCCLLVGAVLGKVLLVGVFSYVGLSVATERLYWVRVLWPSVLKQFVLHAHSTLWSVLALGWLVLIRDAARGKAAVPVALGLLGAMPLLALVFDQTRVVAIVSFPLLWVSWLHAPSLLDTLDDRFVAWLFLAWLFVPWAWTYGGFPQWSVLPHDLALVVGVITDWYELPANLHWWPFHLVKP
jgi:hypothetical protein